MEVTDFIAEVAAFNRWGESLLEEIHWTSGDDSGTVPKITNEFWTSAQRKAHSLHEISYRACYKPQLPRFFIERLSKIGDSVYDPFMGRGTTILEAALLKRKPLGNDINPLSKVLLEPRFNPPTISQIEKRLGELDLSSNKESNDDLLTFFHPDTLRQIIALKEHCQGDIEPIDKWIRMVAINRLTGHSNGFFSVYSMPPNQAVSLESQRRINAKRQQTPPSKDILPRILAKSKSLLKDWDGLPLSQNPILSCNDAAKSTLDDASVDLVVTSPPFLDVIDYQGDNWLRCWFLGLDSTDIAISQIKGLEKWQEMITEVLVELYRVVKPGGFIAFEVGEIRGGKILMEDLVIPSGIKAGLEPIVVIINAQDFTKTSNTWGVSNQSKGTNTNRIIVFRRPEK
jgi:DNA modification methylase